MIYDRAALEVKHLRGVSKNGYTDFLMHGHSFGVLPNSSVHLREQAAHLQCSFVQRSPDSSQIVADIFCDVNG